MYQKQVALQLEKETKGALRYQEVGPSGAPVELADAVIGTLYVRKSAMEGKTPEAISVTVAW